METDFLIDRFSFVSRYFSARFRKKLAKDLFQARLAYSPDDYIALSFGVSVICFFFSLAPLSLSLDYLPFSVLAFVVPFFLITKYPEAKKRRIAREAEKEMPNFLRIIGIELDMGLPFELSVKNACNQSALGREVRSALKSIDNGSSVHEAFNSLSSRIDSNFVKRGSSQLIEAYEKGSGSTLKKLAGEQESIVRARLKEYNGKLAVYSLLFIAASAVLPAISQAFIIVGSSFLDIGVSPLQALLIPVFLFPVVNASLFALVWWKKP